MAGNRVPLNLGPLHTGSGRRVPLDLGVPWDDDTEPPVEPLRATWMGAVLAWDAGARVHRPMSLVWGQSGSVDRSMRTRWTGAAPVSRPVSIAWGSLGRVQGAWRIRHQDAARLAMAARMSWRGLPRVTQAGGSAWGNSGRRDRALGGQWGSGAVRQRLLGGQWHGRMPVRTRHAQAPWGQGAALERRISMPWGIAAPVPWLVLPPPPPPPPPPPSGRPRGNRVGLSLGCPPADLAGIVPLNLGVTACYAVRPARRYYVIINSLSVVRLPDRAEIHAESVDIAASVGAFAWDLTMTLADPDHLALVTPTVSGPAEVEVTVNGHVWTFIVESHSRQRAWDDQQGLLRTVTVTGRSRTALLAAPYAPARSLVSTLDKQAVQLVDAELEFTGFAADYDAINWVVPAGAWYYEGATALDAITRVATASGAVVLSDPEAKALRIRPRYPISPWDWTTTTPDDVVLDDVILDESVSVRSAPLYDAVIVAGELEGKGVLVKVARDGSAGNLYAQQATDPLINTVPVAAERGRNILSDRGEQATFDLTVPMFPAASTTGPHRVQPLDLLQVQDAAGDWVGLATAVRVSVRREGGAVVVEQIITAERHFSDAN
jgi:hypothetical protein